MVHVAIIILIIILMILLLPISIFLIGAIAASLLISNDKKYLGGDWICHNLQDNYGNRCVETTLDTEFKNKIECETFCLLGEETQPDVDNIIKFTHDSGIIFPIPKEFLIRMKRGDLHESYENFMEKNLSGRVTSYIKRSPNELCSVICRNELKNVVNYISIATLPVKKAIIIMKY